MQTMNLTRCVKKRKQDYELKRATFSNFNLLNFSFHCSKKIH